MKKYDLSMIEQLLTRDIDPWSLAVILEEVLWRYVGLLLAGYDGQVPNEQDANMGFDVRQLIEALKAVARSVDD